MGAHNAGRRRGVGGIRRSSGGNFRDADGRGVCCEDGVGRADGGKLGEDVKLQLGDFRDGLDDKINRREILHLRAGREEGTGLIGLLLTDSLLGNILCQ